MDRKTDTDTRTRFRSERFFVSQGEWFCNTREGQAPLGPFSSREAAESAIYQHLVEQGIDPGDDPWGKPGASN